MKRSEMFKEAQKAVLRDTFLSEDSKLEIIKELQDKESTALYWERKEAEEKEKAENGTV